MEEYEDDLTIYPFLDEAVFSMSDRTIDWGTVNEMTDADPDSYEYNKMLHKIGIKGKTNNWTRRSFRGDYYDE